MTHTKEPWTWEEHELSTGYSAVVYDPDGMAIDTHLTAEKADHIANCMNACAGLNPAAIPDVVEALRRSNEALKSLPEDIFGHSLGAHPYTGEEIPVGYIRDELISDNDRALVALQVQS